RADALREMSVNMASSLDIKDVFEAVLQHGMRMTASSAGQVVLVFEDGIQTAASRDTTGYDISEAQFRQVAQSGSPAFPDDRKTMVAVLASGEGVSAAPRLHRDSSLEGAATLAHRVVEAVRAARIETTPGQFLSFSVGVATYPHDALGVEELVMAADQALYLAKREGRDRASTFPMLVERLERSQEELVTALDEAGPQVVVAVGHAIDHHNPLTHGHSSRVAALAETLARRTGYPAADLE